MKTKNLLFALVIFSSIVSYSQEDVSQYFNDGGISQRKNVISYNLTAMINGDFTVGYQRRLTDIVFLEAGVGILTPNFLFELADFGNSIFIQPYLGKGGLSYYFHPKFQYSGDDRYSFTLGGKFRNRAYRADGTSTLTVKDYMFFTTAAYNIGKFMVLEFGTGIGLSTRESVMGREIGFAYPFDIKLGFIL